MIEIRGRRALPAGRPLRVLHTSDWHLGRELAETDRTADFRAMLDWLLGVIRERGIDVLLVAGDVFDTPMPPSSAQKLYFDFLAEAAETDLLGVVVAAGNHDSQRFLSAPSELLAAVRCAVSSETAEGEAAVVRDADGRAVLGVAAVPYLREGDVRGSSAEMDEADRARLWEAGVAARYADVRDRLRLALQDEPAMPPLVAMGHLFVTGARPSAGLLRRSPAAAIAAIAAADAPDSGGAAGSSAFDPSHYVGSLRNVGAQVFGSGWAYAALGHIHEAQAVKAPGAGYEVRYSGAPLALDFTHEHYRHQVVLAEIAPDGRTALEAIDVPQPRLVKTLRGGLDALLAGIAEAGRASPGAIVACVAERAVAAANRRVLVKALDDAARQAKVILGPVVAASQGAAREEQAPLKRLDDITPLEVFEDVLGAAEAAQAGDPQRRARLLALFAEAEADARAAMAAERAKREARAPSEPGAGDASGAPDAAAAD